MSHKEDLALMAHLLRRAGFGSTQEELEYYTAKGYEATVEELVNPPDNLPAGNSALLLRYQPGVLLPGGQPFVGVYTWLFNMLTTKRPLEEKITLFWHHVFATGNSKVDNCDQMLEQVVMLRKHGMGNYRDLLVEVAKNPAMIYWLDNNENHRDSVNENWGRELLELFSMGVSNYTEVDVREASRAFTGWTIQPKLPRRRPMAGSRGALNTCRKTTTTPKSPFWATPARSTAKTSSTSWCSNRPRRGSSVGICTTSSSPTRCRCPLGPSNLPGTRKPWK